MNNNTRLKKGDKQEARSVRVRWGTVLSVYNAGFLGFFDESKRDGTAAVSADHLLLIGKK